VWQKLIIAPLSFVFLFLYDKTGNYGLAILLFTVISKLVLLPFSMKGKKSMMAMQRVNPKMKELEAKYKDNKAKYNEELAKLYREEKVNPLGGCLWQLLPWPIFIALYDVMRRPLSNMMRLTADQITALLGNSDIVNYLTKHGIDAARAASESQIGIASAMHENFASITAAFPEFAAKLINIDYSFLGLNLSLKPVISVLNVYWLLPIISGAVVWLSTKIMQKMNGPQQNDQANQTAQYMTYLGPAMSIWIGYMLPAAMCFYWIASSVVGIIQDLILNRYYNKKFDQADAAKALSAAEAKSKKAPAEKQDKPKAEKPPTALERQYQKLKAQQESENKNASGSPAGDDEGSDEE